MAHVGTITGSMVLDPSAYIAGLNRAAQHTAAFQSSIQAGTAGINAFAKASQSMAVGMSRLNGSVYASMTAFYALSRVVSSSLGVFEEYNNIIARISATADLSINSVTALSESFKKLNRELGGSRTDLMKGVYRAVQANFTTPEEFMPIGAAAMRLRTASGREIDTTKSADVISVIRNALGIKSGREGFITDMLLRGRDIGRYELTEMASALGIPITLFGNQFSAKLGPEETLRQLIAILSSATQTGLNPRTAATGTRRMVEKTTRLMKYPEGIGKNLTTALRSMGFSSISEALNQGPMAFLETISRLTGGSPEALTHLGYGSRDIMLLTSALRNNMGQTREFYGKLAPGEIGGTTDKYLDRHKQTWWYQRDRLRSAYEDSQLKLMQAMIPVLSSFANSLEVVNDLFQALAPSIKRLIGLMTIGAGFSILRNFYVRSTGGKFGAQGSDNLMKNLPVMGAWTPRTADYYGLRRIIVPNKYVPPVKSPIGNQIYSGFGNIFRIAHPSYYGGGISSVGWRPLDSNNAQGHLIPIIPTPQKIMPYNIQNLNRKYNSAFMNPNAKHLNRVQIKSKPFSVKAEQQRAIDLYNWNLRREALIAQNLALSAYLRNAYGPNRVLEQATREMQERWMWGNQRRADGRPMYTRGPVKKYRLPPMRSSMGMNKDWSSGRSFVGQAIREGYPRMRDNFYDSAFRFLGRASDNVQRFSEGYGKAKGWLKESWLGKGGAFAFGGNEYRLNRIQKMYDARIEAANKAFVSGGAGADRGADWMRDTARQVGVNPMAASRIAAQHFNSTMDQVTKNFNKATASAANTAKWMSRVSGVMSGLGSIGNLVALGAVIQLLSDFINGLNSPKPATKSGGVIDLSKAGKLHSINMLNPGNIWDNIRFAADLIGTTSDVGFDWLSGGERNLAEEVVDSIHQRALKKGRIPKEDLSSNLLQRLGFDILRVTGIGGFLNPSLFEIMSTRKATLSDSLERALRENFSPLEQRQLRLAGYGKMTPELQRSFEEFLKSGKLGNKYEGITHKDFGQRTNIPGRDPNETGYDIQTEFLTSFLKEMSSLGETIKKTTSSVKSFNMTAKQTDHIIEYLKNNYREYFLSFVSGAKQIETRGMLYDQQADRSLTPNEQSIWQSSGYREKMALAASDLFTPKHRFGGEDKFASFENWAKQQKENERYSGFSEYEDAKRNYFKASSNEQTASMLAVLLPKLATLSTSDARKQLEGIYGGKLNLDNVGIDRLRNTDLSRYFSEKPRDQLNSKSQFMSYGTTETYNSIISMTPPEIIELQANRQAILDLQEAITQNSDKLLRDFDGKFEKFVADKLDKIVENTAILANAALFGNTPDLVSSLDNG